MASETVPESTSEEKPTIISHSEPPTSYNSQFLEHKDTPWVDYAIHQARLYQKTAQETLDSAIEASRSRLSQILSTSSAYLHQTLDSLQDVKFEIGAYEELSFGKIKEGILIAASNTLLTGGPRHFLHYKALRLLLSEESLISRADAKVKQLRQSLDATKAESEKLETSREADPRCY